MLLEVGGSFGGALADGQAGSVGGNDGAGTAMGGHAIKEFALDLEIFSDGFDDPVGFGAARQIVFEIADGDAAGNSGREKWRWARFEGGFHAEAGDSLSHT